MSLGGFLSHLWGQIKGVFDKIAPDVKDAIHWAVVVTDTIKKFEDSGTADILEKIVGGVPAAINEKIRAALPDILVKLKLADKCANLTDTQQIVKCAVDALQSVEGDFKSAFLHDISIIIAQVASDGKLSWSDGVFALEWYYKHKYQQEQTGNA
jgi:hypothetical protein